MRRSVLITGGAGFIGTNLAHRLCEEGRRVLIYDNLSRPGVEKNLRWLVEKYRDSVLIEIADVRDRKALNAAVARAEQVFHFAAQVAVTTSLVDPVEDFDINIRGTLNLLEAARSSKNPPPIVFASTNKVYGAIDDLPLCRSEKRYAPAIPIFKGVSEQRPLDFHSPYGCSKGAADQYVIDYARSYGIPTVVFRMSCIYGPHQFGTEDQGWVAHFLIRALQNEPIILYGDGLQVRDVLYIDDLVNALLMAHDKIDVLSGRAFNIGGGARHTTSLLELIALIEILQGSRPKLKLDRWRTGDQRYYVSDISRFVEATSWKPMVSINEGVRRLYDWLRGSYRIPVMLPPLRAQAISS